MTDHDDRPPGEVLRDIVLGTTALPVPEPDDRPYGDIAQGPRGEPPAPSAADAFADFVRAQRR